MKTKKRIYYHGTTIDNLESIKINGLSPNEPKVWEVSNNEIYLWDAKRVLEDYDQQDEDFCKKVAFESAYLALGISNSNKCVVLRMEINPDEYEIQEDFSCENMASRGAVCTSKSIPFSYVTDYYTSPDLSALKPYFLSVLLSNDLFNIHNFEIPLMQLKIAEALKKQENYELFELLDEIELNHEYSKKKIKHNPLTLI